MPSASWPSLASLGRELPLGSASAVFAAAAERVAALHGGVAAAALLERMTSGERHHASLRGKLLLMEVACPGLGQPHAFYLLGTAGDVAWRGALLRLFLFGLYAPGAVGSYLSASARLYRDALTAETLRAWLGGRSWPEEAARSGRAAQG